MDTTSTANDWTSTVDAWRQGAAGSPAPELAPSPAPKRTAKKAPAKKAAAKKTAARKAAAPKRAS